MRISIGAFLSLVSPALEILDCGHLLDLAYNRKTWAYPMSTVLPTVAFLLLVDASLLLQGGFMHYSQQLTLQHSTKLLFVFFFFFLSRSKLIFKVPTTT